MNIRSVVLGMVLLVPCLVFAVITPAQVSPITSYVNGGVKIVLIHPTVDIQYDFLVDNEATTTVRALQESYDLVYLAISSIRNSDDINIYNMKKTAVLKIGTQTTNCVDFYDVDTALWGGFSGSGRIFGYLLFPKVIDSSSTQRVTIECEINGTRHSFDVNFEKLRNLINILSDN